VFGIGQSVEAMRWCAGAFDGKTTKTRACSERGTLQ
jgi:hypothetical protein